MASIAQITANDTGARAKINAAISEANKVDGKADKTALDAVSESVGQKATQAALNALSSSLANSVATLTQADSALSSSLANSVATLTQADAELSERVFEIFPGQRERPGDRPTLFTSSLSGRGRDLIPISIGSVVVGASGHVRRFNGVGPEPLVIANRIATACELGLTYAARFTVRRVSNTSDPLGDTIEFGLALLNSSQVKVSERIVGSFNLVVADGPKTQQVTFSRDLVSADEVLSATARYVRPFVRIYGGDGVTDVEVIGTWETNGLPGPKGDVGDLTPAAIAARDQILTISGQVEESRQEAEFSAEAAEFESGRAEGFANAAADSAVDALDGVDSITKATWAQLAAVAGTRDGQRGTVPEGDTGTHTDPVTSDNDVANSGIYAWYSTPGAWRRVGDYFATSVRDVEARADFALLQASDRGIAYEQDIVWAVDDEEGNIALAIHRSGYLEARLTSGGLSPEYSYFELSDDGAIIGGIRQWDGFGFRGVRPALDVRVFMTGPEGSRTVWACANGLSPWPVSQAPGNFHAPALEGRYVKWVEIAEGISLERFEEASPPEIQIDTVIHIPVLGQSLATGSFDGVVVHPIPVRPGRALSFNSGPRTLPGHSGSFVSTLISESDIATLVNLYERVQGGLGETICSEMALRLTSPGSLDGASAVLTSVHAIGGQPILALSEGTVPYANTLTAIARSKSLADFAEREFVAKSASWIQGEADVALDGSLYQERLEQLQADLSDDVNAVTGETGEFVLVVDQISNWTSYNRTVSDVPFAQLQAAIDNPTKIACVGPKYHLECVADGRHLTGVSEARLGAYHARAHQAVLGGDVWEPLYPTGAVRSGATVTITFHVPVGPISLDTTLVDDPGNYGFEWSDAGDGNGVSIIGVELISANQVSVTLSSEPTGTGGTIGIAASGISGNNGGPTTGPRSNLRDSSPDFDSQGYPMFNWCCHSLIAVS